MEWRITPLKKNLLITMGFFLFIALVVWALQNTFNNWVHTGMITLVFLLFLWPVIVPTKFILSDEGITVDHLVYKRNFSWVQFKKYLTEKNGIFLSPFEKSSRIENFRGIFLIFNNNKDEVTAFVKNKMTISEISSSHCSSQ